MDFNKRPLRILGFITVEVKVGNNAISNARVLIAPDGHKSLVGRDWLNHLQYQFTAPKQQNSEYSESIFLVEPVDPELVNLQKQFPKLFSEKGRIKDYCIKIEFLPDAKITQQKGRRIPLQLQTAVDAEIKRLIKEGHISPVKNIRDDVFIQPTVVTVKKDRSVKIALDARALNAAIKKDKYPMPNLENLIDQVAEILNSNSGEAWFTTLDLQYAYGQVPLHADTAKHCNFQIIGGAATGIYCFQTGYYGLTIMPTEFQKIMDSVLVNCKNTFTFIDDILVVSKGTKADHLEKVREVLQTLSKEDFSSSDSTVLIRERTRGSKLEPLFKKKQGQILKATPHTVSFLPAGRNQPIILSKRDIGQSPSTSATPLTDAFFTELNVESSQADIIDAMEKSAISTNADISTTSEHAQPVLPQPTTTDPPLITIDDSDKSEINASSSPTQRPTALKKLRENALETIARKRAINKIANKKKRPSPKPVPATTSEAAIESSDDDIPFCILHTKQPERPTTSAPDASVSTTVPNRQSARHHRKPDWYGNNVLGFIEENA